MRLPPKRELCTFQGHGSEQKGLGPAPRLPGDHVPPHTCTLTDTDRCTRVNAHTHMQTCAHRHPCVQTYTCSQIYLHTRHADTAVHMQIGARTRTRAHVQIRAYT